MYLLLFYLLQLLHFSGLPGFSVWQDELPPPPLIVLVFYCIAAITSISTGSSLPVVTQAHANYAMGPPKFLTNLANSIYAISLWHCHYVYSAPGKMVNASEFILSIYAGILLPLMHVK